MTSSESTRNDYSDDYASCLETHATLRLYHEANKPNEVGNVLGLRPSHEHPAKEWITRPSGWASPASWFLESAESVQSRDLRRHLDWLMDRISDKGEALAVLRALGWRAEVNCFWVSAIGHGGPTITPSEMRVLASLDLPLTFDIYFYAP